MKLLTAISFAFLLYGCCSTETATRTEFVPFVPDEIRDSLDQLVNAQMTGEAKCDSAINAAIINAIEFVAEDTTNDGDFWKVQAVASQDSLRRYRRLLSIAVRPKPDSIPFAYAVKMVRPWNLWEQIRLSGFLPMIILWLGTVFILVLLYKLK